MAMIMIMSNFISLVSSYEFATEYQEKMLSQILSRPYLCQLNYALIR